MSGPGTVARDDPQRIAAGELAFLGACASVARLDFEHQEARDWLDAATQLGGQLSLSAVALDVLALSRLADALVQFSYAVEDARRLPTGERDWIAAARYQGELRQALTDAMASLYHRTIPTWRNGEAPPWAVAAAPCDGEPEVMEAER